MKKMQPKIISVTSCCPKHYCFFFTTSESFYAAGSHENLEEAMNKLQPITQDGCSCAFGLCKRLDPNGDHDYYEPCEPELDKDELPHNYFTMQ